MRIKFRKGKQREFIDRVLRVCACPSLRELINRGIDVDHSSLKSYYSERRLLPKGLFEVLCELSDMNKDYFDFREIDENWGQVKGGKISKR